MKTQSDSFTWVIVMVLFLFLLVRCGKTDFRNPDCMTPGTGLADSPGEYLADGNMVPLTGYLDTICMRITPAGDTIIVFDIR